MNARETQPEIALLLALARVELRPEHIEKARELIRAGIDWHALLGLAQRHEMLPLLQRHLHAGLGEQIPRETLETLRAYAHRTALNNLTRAAELRKIIKTLGQSSIPVLAYKGPTLTCLAYGDLALREYCDLDFIVPINQLLKTRLALRTVGYRSPWNLPDYLEEKRIQVLGEMSLLSDTGIYIEIHSALVPSAFPFPFDLRGLWERQTSIPILGTAVPTFSDGDLLLFLCIHGAKHYWGSLKWVVDVAELLRVRPSLDWETIFALAQRSRSERMLRLGLALASDLLGITISSDLRRRIRSDMTIKPLVGQIRRNLFAEQRKSIRVSLAMLSFMIQSRDRLRDGLRYPLSIVFEPTRAEWERLRLPYALSWFYYPFRVARHGLNLMGRLFHRLTSTTESKLASKP